MVDYASEITVCRSRVLLSYFGERDSKDCGQCDVCLRKSDSKVAGDEFKQIEKALFELLKGNPLSLAEITSKIKQKESKVIEVLRFLIDNDKVDQDRRMRYLWRKK